MGCGCCFGFIIVLMNVLFCSIAILFIAIGSVLHFFADIAKTYFAAMLDGLSSLGITMDEVLAGDETFRLIDLLKQIALPFIIVGVILFAICILGCCSVYCSNKTLLIVYMAILGVVLAAQILAVIIIYVKMPDYRAEVIASLKTSVTNDYEGRSSSKSNETTNFFTTILDLVQMQVGCCGIDSYRNFENATKWQQKKQPSQNVPPSCCVMDDNRQPRDRQKCAAANDSNYAYITVPCWDRVDELAAQNNTILIAILAGILGIQALILLLSICYFQSISSKIGPV